MMKTSADCTRPETTREEAYDPCVKKLSSPPLLVRHVDHVYDLPKPKPTMHHTSGIHIRDQFIFYPSLLLYINSCDAMTEHEYEPVCDETI
jgi:hypothetical protein